MKRILLSIFFLLFLAGQTWAQQPSAKNYTPVRVGDGTAFLHTAPLPVDWFTSGFNSIGATLTEVKAAPAAGVSIYVTDIAIQTTTATSGTYAFQSGTGTNCGTATTTVFPVSGAANRFNAPINSQAMANFHFVTPIKLTAAHALCVIGVVTNTVSGQVNGYTAP